MPRTNLDAQFDRGRSDPLTQGSRPSVGLDAIVKPEGAYDVLRDLRGASEAGAMGCLSRQCQDAAAGAGTGRWLHRQYPLQEPDARRVDPVAVRLARRE